MRARRQRSFSVPKLTETRALVALSSRNFRLYFLGQCCALTGTWMQRLAMSWLVLTLTGSGASMGLVEFANQAPVFLIGLFTGVFLDRHDLRLVLMGTQIAMIAHSLTLAFLLYTGLVTYEYVLILSFLLGIITALDMPARQASVSQMINHPSQLQSALSLQSGSFNLARLAGPAVAGFIIKAGGEMACFVLNAVAHLAVLYAYFIMKLPERKLASLNQRPMDAIREGIRYAFGVRPIKLVMLHTYAFCGVAFPYMVLLPLFAKHVLDGDSRHLGFLLGGVGIGALAGVMYLAAKVSLRALPRYIALMQTCFGLTFLVFSFVTDWRISFLLSPAMGFFIVSSMVSSNTLLQALVDEDKRGRVLSLFSFAMLGFGPIGALSVGKLADHLGAPTAAAISASLVILLGLVHFTRRFEYDATVDGILSKKGL